MAMTKEEATKKVAECLGAADLLLKAAAAAADEGGVIFKWVGPNDSWLTYNPKGWEESSWCGERDRTIQEEGRWVSSSDNC